MSKITNDILNGRHRISVPIWQQWESKG